MVPVQRILDELLEGFGASSGTWGELEPLSAEAIPAPYHDLLVHPRDMTRTLERHLDAHLELDTLLSRREGDQLFRQVLLLEREPARRVAEAGAIRIELQALPADARAEVLAQELPLGGILHTFGVEHYGEPQAYFTCRPHQELSELLGSPAGAPLHGRLSRLRVRPGDRLLAEAIEILPVL